MTAVGMARQTETRSSLLTVAFVAGVGTFVYVPRMIDQRPTPGVGVVERTFFTPFCSGLACSLSPFFDA
jgi:hypothetical protein